MESSKHIFEDGKELEELGPTYFCGLVEVADLVIQDESESSWTPLDPDIVGVLWKTGNSHSYLWELASFQPNFTGLPLPLAQRLIETSGIRFVGADYLSIEAMATEGAVHRQLLAAGVAIVEGLDLVHVSPGLYEMVSLFLRIRHAEASPGRVLLRPWNSNLDSDGSAP